VSAHHIARSITWIVGAKFFTDRDNTAGLITGRFILRYPLDLLWPNATLFVLGL